MSEDANEVEEAIDEESTVAEAEAETTEEETQAPSDSSPENDEPEWFKKRIGEMTWKQREAERERDYWKEQATKEPEPKAEPLEVKTLEDFDYDDKAYQAHLIETSKSQATEAAKQAIREEQATIEAKARQKAFETKESKYAEEVKDYLSVTRSESLVLTKDMVDVAALSDDGPALLYYLGKNPDISAAIANLPPLAAAKEMGKIEAKLSKETKSASKAPPPPPKIDGVNAGHKVKPDEPDSDKLSMDQWLKARNKQLAR